jgi:RNA polymerase sigma factor (sigma-70 family)
MGANFVKNAQRKQNCSARSNQLCGTCIMMSILNGDFSIINAFFFSIMGKNRTWFWNIRSLNSKEMEMILDDICAQVSVGLWEKFKLSNPSVIRNPISLIWCMTKYISIDMDKKLGQQKRIENKIDYYEFCINGKNVLSDDMKNNVTGESIFGQNETREIVRKVIKGLKRHHRRLIYLRYFKGLSDIEISRRTGMSVNSVRVTLHYLRKKIRPILEKRLN